MLMAVLLLSVAPEYTLLVTAAKAGIGAGIPCERPRQPLSSYG
jgi:hypothetical protein